MAFTLRGLDDGLLRLACETTAGQPEASVIVSAWAPTFRVKSTVDWDATWTGTSLLTTDPNPVRDAVTSYVPAGRPPMWKLPEALATAVRVRPVETFFAVTVAPGTAALVSSKTLPSMLPVSDSAAHKAAGRTARPRAKTNARARNRRRDPFIFSLTSISQEAIGLPVRHALCHARGARRDRRKALQTLP